MQRRSASGMRSTVGEVRPAQGSPPIRRAVLAAPADTRGPRLASLRFRRPPAAPTAIDRPHLSGLPTFRVAELHRGTPLATRRLQSVGHVLEIQRRAEAKRPSVLLFHKSLRSLWANLAEAAPRSALDALRATATSGSRGTRAWPKSSHTWRRPWSHVQVQIPHDSEDGVVAALEQGGVSLRQDVGVRVVRHGGVRPG